MSYVKPAELAVRIIDAGESKVFMSTRDTLIRSFMAGAILALAAAFAVTISVRTGEPLLGAVLFPVGFCMLHLLGFDLLTAVFTLVPLAWLDKRPGVDAQADAAQLGPGVRREPARCAHRRGLHGGVFHPRVQRRTGRCRSGDRGYRRGPHGRLCRAWRRPGC